MPYHQGAASWATKSFEQIAQELRHAPGLIHKPRILVSAPSNAGAYFCISMNQCIPFSCC